MEILKLGSRALTLEDVYDVALNYRQVELSEAAVEKIEKSHSFLTAKIKTSGALYGVNTGFGLLSNVRIPDPDIETLQYNLLRSHACGMGQPLDDRYVRAMLLLRAANLAIGNSGVRVELVQHVLDLLNRGVHPVIPEQGSVGASGDLAPLSHLALVLIGEGKAHVKGKLMSGAQALESVGLKPIRLGPKEGLALINGTQFMTAIGALSVLDAEKLCDIADFTGSMSVEALRGTVVAFEPEIHAVRPHPGQIRSAQNIRSALLSGGGKSEIAKSHEGCARVQDPYSLRCMPQVHGVARDAVEFVRQILEREINSVTDNPLVFPESGKIMSGGNFHGQYVSFAMDILAMSVAELANISEQRIEKLINPSFSELPAFLAPQGGLNSGFMIVQVTAASIVSENKTLCHPASVDSISTSADKEDHVSMGAWAARKASQVIRNSERVLSLELLAAAQGIDLLRPNKSSAVIENIHQMLRWNVKKVESDRAFYEDFEHVKNLFDSVEFNQVLKECFYGSTKSGNSSNSWNSTPMPGVAARGGPSDAYE